jgi:hypothetical protein
MRSRPLLRTQLCRTKDPFHRAGIPLIVDVTTPRLEFFQRRDWLPVAATPLHGLPTESFTDGCPSLLRTRRDIWEEARRKHKGCRQREK